MKVFKILLAIVVLAALAYAGWYWFGKGKNSVTAIDTTPTTNAVAKSFESKPLSEIYTDETYHFSINYPEGMTASSFPDESSGGYAVVIADSATGIGMQVLITPFDEDLTVLTVDRIRKDQPQLTILEPQEVEVGDKGRGVAFLDGSGDTANRQIWFIRDSYLYQITGPKSADQLIKNMLNTWAFTTTN